MTMVTPSIQSSAPGRSDPPTFASNAAYSAPAGCLSGGDDNLTHAADACPHMATDHGGAQDQIPKSRKICHQRPSHTGRAAPRPTAFPVVGRQPRLGAEGGWRP